MPYEYSDEETSLLQRLYDSCPVQNPCSKRANDYRKPKTFSLSRLRCYVPHSGRHASLL